MNKGLDDLYNQIKQSEEFIEYSMNLYSVDNEETYFGFGIMKFEIDMLLYDRFN